MASNVVASHKPPGKNAAPKSMRKMNAVPSEVETSQNGIASRRKVSASSADGQASVDGVAPLPTGRKPLRIATVSHTLDADVAERLRHFAFRERISESAVIEFALRDLFDETDDLLLGQRLRDAGAALRRKS